MTSLRKTEAPDLMTQIIETRRRNLETRHLETQAASIRRDDAQRHSPTLASQIIYALLFSTVLVCSTLLGSLAGLCVVALIFAFLIAPISAPFFVVGALMSAAAFYALNSTWRLAGRTARYGRRAHVIPAASEPQD